MEPILKTEILPIYESWISYFDKNMMKCKFILSGENFELAPATKE